MTTLNDIKAKLKGYKNKDRAAEQILEVITNFPQLKLSKPIAASCPEESMLNEKCLALLGTVPIYIQGSQYFIPVSILVMLDHPKSGPHVYIKPTANMELVLSGMVNSFGRVDIQFLRNWNRESSLIDLVSVMSIEFAGNSPVQARSNPPPAPAPAQPRYNPQPMHQQPSEFQTSVNRSLPPNFSGYQPTNQYQQPRSLPSYPPRQTYPPQPGYQQQPDQQQVAYYQRALAEEREKTERAERNLYDDRMLLTQTQQSLLREEQRANSLQDRVSQLESELAVTRNRLETAERNRQMADERARAVQRGVVDKKEQQYWIVGKDEIEAEAKQLGSGGWATVRVAKFRHMQVAAKYMHQLIISDYNRELFVREMNMAARMRHPNIVQFIGASMEGEAVILTELMATSLRAQYSKQMLTYPQILSISEDVAKGLNYLHLTKPDPIIHRDISSANVLLEPLRDNKWRAKICDCGSANFALLTNTVGPGNPTYAAPEADRPKEQSTKMDVFSYGVVLLETNTQRFPDPRTRELLFDMLGHRQEMVGLIRWCTETTPTDRPSMEDVLVSLEDIEKRYKQK